MSARRTPDPEAAGEGASGPGSGTAPAAGPGPDDPSTGPPAEIDFETALEELERIVSELDREGVGLDEAIRLFESGLERLRVANRWLEEATGRVEQLIADAAGRLETRSLDTDARSDVSGEDDRNAGASG